MKDLHPFVRGAVLVLSVTAMSLAVVKAQGCQTPDAPVPAASAPLTEAPEGTGPAAVEPAPAVATPDVGGSADGDVAAPDVGPAIDPMEVLPATKSGGFYQYDDARRRRPAEPVQQQAAPE